MKRTVRPAAFGLLFGLLAGTAAQATYKVVGPDGRITYTDRPPAQAGQVQAVGTPGRATPPGPEATLPFDLRQVMARYPVVLYTSADCQPCDAGRTLLRQRGIPHTEYSIGTAADAEALRKQAGSSEVPQLAIGAQRIKGYSSSEWNSYLDAAGYPKQSRLPAHYRFAEAQPLAPPTPAAAPAPAPDGPAAATAPSPAAPLPPAGNAPPGFRF
ncbi:MULTISPECIES: glutaredoxin family protein [Caldimonas]|uniref:glutaredoxin family protein n=1 Tax=Caldimonas TaxID=196013 RepID=UPI00037079DA|nr:glutaredoxin family protein [Caldimonas manganoxidans]